MVEMNLHGEMHEMAKRIAENLKKGGQIGWPFDPRIVVEVAGENVNCYPGVPSSACHNTAIFLSFSQYTFGKKRGNISFSRILDLLVTHMLGTCAGKTRNALVLTDTWEPYHYMDKLPLIDSIRKQAVVEFYLVVPGLFVQQVA